MVDGVAGQNVQVDVIAATTVPTSYFSVTGTICSGLGKFFNDTSIETPTAWNWQTTPSSGVIINSSNSQNPSISFPTAGIYTISLTTSNGFGTGSTASQTVNVAAPPILTLTSSGLGLPVCVDQPVLLSADGANTYTWSPGSSTGSSLNIVASLTNAITYTVKAKSSEGCVATETISLMVSECTGISDRNGGKGLFEVYPNPGENSIFLRSNLGTAMNLQIEIIDLAGKSVFKQNSYLKKGKNEVQLNVSLLTRGVYVLNVKLEDGKTQHIKWLKE